MSESLDDREAVIGRMNEDLFAGDETADARDDDAAAQPVLFAGDETADVRDTAQPANGERPAAGEPGCGRRDLSPPPGNDDPQQWPAAGDDPGLEAWPWGPPDDYPGGDEAEYAAWVASMPDDVRADHLAGPYTGAGEVIPPGFTHRDPGGPTGVGFAAGGALDTLAPGPWLARELADVSAAGHDQLGESELIGVLLGWQRQAAWSQAGLAAAVAAVAARRRAQAARPGRSQLGEHVADELAVALTLTRQSAARLLDQAIGLDRLPEIAAALGAGAIDWARATLLTELLAVLPDEQARAVAARLLGRASEQTTGQLRAATERAVLAADPDAALRRQNQARKEIRVEIWHEPSGNAALAGRELPPADAIAAEAALTADADWLQENGATGTLAELRAAAYLTRLSGRDLTDLLPHDDTAAEGASSNPGGNFKPGTSSEPADSGRPPGHGGPRASGGPGDGGGPRGSGGPGDGGGTARSTGRGGNAGGRGAFHPASSGGTGASRARRGGSIQLTMPLASLAGLSDAPGEVAGYGTADAGTCQDLATRLGADPASRWCLTLTGPDGRAVGHACAGRRGPGTGQPLISWATGLRDKLELLETGTCSHTRQSPGYPWPASLRHLIEVRQRTCTAPGCRRKATACDIDHTIPFDQGGPTCECNGAPLCRRHHRAKQAPGWRLTQDQPGHMTWRLPSGRSYQTAGDPY
jgi:hypothetical protein